MAMLRWIGLAACVLWGCVPAGGGSGGSGGTDGAIIDVGPMGDGGPSADGAPGPDDAEMAPDVPPSAPGAPRILSLEANVPRLTEGEALRISAVVTDDDGVEDVLGGVLEDPAGGVYGAFESTGAGTYQVDVDWAALNRTSPIEFVGDAERVLWARFFDQAGLETVGSVRVTLFCVGGGACAGSCLELMSDLANCGGCGVTCPAVEGGDAICEAGACGGTCPGARQLCGSRCLDTGADPSNCGDCGVVCDPVAGGEAVCQDGRCAGDCPGGGLACGGACVDTRTDVDHCGGCGVVCPGEAGEQRCEGGVCLMACSPGDTICDGACVDIADDARNCGECGLRCARPAGGEAECADGACTEGTCPGQQAPCGGICTDLETSHENCGRCFRFCEGEAQCTDGECVLMCPPGELACGDECSRCPSAGVTDVRCDGDACIATACAADLVLYDGRCAPRVDELIYESSLPALVVGLYPPVSLDLTFDDEGQPYLMVGRLLPEGDVFIEAGPRDMEFGWQLSDFNIFDRGRESIRVGVVALPDGRMVHGWAYGREDRSRFIGAGMDIRGVGARVGDRLPGNTGGDLWGFSTAAVLVDGQLDAQMSISIDNPVNRSISRYTWDGAGLSLTDPFINGIVHHAVDATGDAHFAYHPDLGGALSWRQVGDVRATQAVGENATVIGGIRVGPQGPVIAYAREPDTTLRVARRLAGDWQLNTVDPAAVGGQFWGFDLELDAEGHPVLCYWREGSVYVARFARNGWTRTRVGSAEGAQTDCAVAIDPAGDVSVAYVRYIDTDDGRARATFQYVGLAPGLP